MSRRVEIPPAWRATLEELFGESVEDVRIFEHAKRLRLHGRAVATTRRGRIYLRGSADSFFRDPALVLHEFFHVMKQWKPRTLTTPRYVAELLRRGYWDNRFEVEAREFVDDHLHRFQALLSRRIDLSPVAPAEGRRRRSAQNRLALVKPPRDKGEKQS